MYCVVVPGVNRCRGPQGSWALWALTFYNPNSVYRNGSDDTWRDLTERDGVGDRTHAQTHRAHTHTVYSHQQTARTPAKPADLSPDTTNSRTLDEDPYPPRHDRDHAPERGSYTPLLDLLVADDERNCTLLGTRGASCCAGSGALLPYGNVAGRYAGLYGLRCQRFYRFEQSGMRSSAVAGDRMGLPPSLRWPACYLCAADPRA
jgi:hypothetical protein